MEFPLLAYADNIFVFAAAMNNMTATWSLVENNSAWSESSNGPFATTDIATTSAYGVTKLSSATNSTAENVAATPKAVKAAYDLAASKGSGTITEVKANGTSIATSGVANIPAASTSAYGVTKLNSATNSTSTSEAATASAVKAAYDLAASKGTGTITKV